MEMIYKIAKKCLHFLPVILLIIIYQSVPAIPFVKVSPFAWIFVAVLFVAGVLLSFNLYIGSIVGIISWVIAACISYFTAKNFDTKVLSFCIVICLYYLYCTYDIYIKKHKNTHK